MYSFNNDYSEIAHPRVLEYLSKYNQDIHGAYGIDDHSQNASRYIKKLIQREDADIHFVSGGTQSNLLVISSFLRPHQAVIAAETAHIVGHESGAIEATGHKVAYIQTDDGKLTPDHINRVLDENSQEYTVKPKMVYISNTTELGTLYSKKELKALQEICREKGLLLFMDGARLGSALTSKSNDLELKDIAQLVDVFYIGGTKNGALFGEAIVLLREELKEEFRVLMKQKGAMLAKGFVLGIQFEALFEDNLYFELAEHANMMAEKVADVIREAGYKLYMEPCSNQVFPIFPNTLLEKMEKEFVYQIQAKINENETAVRFVTSFATKEESIEALKDFFERT